MSTLKPYGDSTGDGRVQLSFTLPLGAGDRALEAATELLRKMGLDSPQVVHMKAIGESFTFFVAYGSSTHEIDPDALVVPEQDHPDLSYPEVNRLLREHLKRRLVVVGACTGTDAHTVGLDAILSLKGYGGEKGLEYVSEMQVINLGAQVAPEEIVAKAVEARADAVLISQVVTQSDAHLTHLREARDALVAAGLRDGLILVGGGPRLRADMAAEIGYDRIFGRGTTPGQVASYLAWTVANRVPA